MVGDSTDSVSGIPGSVHLPKTQMRICPQRTLLLVVLLPLIAANAFLGFASPSDPSVTSPRAGRVGPVETVHILFPRDASPGGHVIDIKRPGALRVKLHFAEFSLPDGASARVLGEDPRDSRIYTALGPKNTGNFWATSVQGDTAQILLDFPDDLANEIKLRVNLIGLVTSGPEEAPHTVCGDDD